MNLISCNCCGVVLDTSKIKKPDVYIDDESSELDGDVDHANAYWDGDTYMPLIVCPVCKHKICYATGEEHNF